MVLVVRVLSVIVVLWGLLIGITASFLWGIIFMLVGLYFLFLWKQPEQSFGERLETKLEKLAGGNRDRKIKTYDVKEYKNIPANEIYRFEKDHANVLRFKREIPEGFVRWQNVGLTGEKVAGTSYRQEVCKKFINGENRGVAVEYDPTEEHPSAIEVLGIWTDNEGQHRERIGYIEVKFPRKYIIHTMTCRYQRF